jgi:hypothetical protein
LKDKDGKEVTRPSEIVKELKEFYKALHKKVETDKNFRQHFLAKIDIKLNIQDRNSLEGLIKNEEVLRELKQMTSGKSPGIDGLGKEFDLTFWEILGDDLVETINKFFYNGN